MMVTSPSGTDANPIGKVFKLVDGGPEHNTYYFVRAIVAGDQERQTSSPGAGFPAADIEEEDY